MSAPIIESQIEAEQLRRRINLLTDENRTLRELATPSAGPIELQAENILLQREVVELADLVPRLVPYTGAPPETFEALSALPEPHRQQIAREHPDHVRMLQQVEDLVRNADEHDRQLARQRAALEGLPAGSAEEFADLDADRRRDTALHMTAPERLAMFGHLPADADEAYL